MAEPIFSDLALRCVDYEPEAQRASFSILNKGGMYGRMP
jgi:hypothetical protein